MEIAKFVDEYIAGLNEGALSGLAVELTGAGEDGIAERFRIESAQRLASEPTVARV